jgi:hypothetical protein
VTSDTLDLAKKTVLVQIFSEHIARTTTRSAVDNRGHDVAQAIVAAVDSTRDFHRAAPTTSLGHDEKKLLQRKCENQATLLRLVTVSTEHNLRSANAARARYSLVFTLHAAA